MAGITKIKRITKGLSKGVRSKLLKGNEEIITLLLIYAIIILWILNFNI
jgi:Na+/H+-translocating membrane pyrophosphatase